MRFWSSRHHTSAERLRGVAAVEMALCLPLIFLVIFGGIEAANIIFLKQAITEAAYEGALYASKTEATQSETLSRVQTILDARNIQTTSITAGLGSTLIDELAPGVLFSIRITAPTNANLISPRVFAPISDVESEVFARKL